MARSYSDPRYGVSVTSPLGQLNLNAAAATSRARWCPPIDETNTSTNYTVKEVTAIIQTAGTTTGTTFNVFKGTSSIGAVAIGTTAAGTRVTASLTDTTFASTDILNIQNSASDATGVATVLVEYQEAFVA